MKTRKQKVLSYILAPILGAGVAAGCIVPAILAKPSKWVDEDTIPTVEVDETTKQEGVSINSNKTSLKVHQQSTIGLNIQDTNKQIGKVEIKVDGKVLSEDDYTIDQETNTIVIKASAMTGTKINVSVNTEEPIGWSFNSESVKLLSRVIRRNGKSSFKFQLKDGYKNPTCGGLISYNDGQGEFISDGMFDITSSGNVYTYTFKSTLDFSNIASVDAVVTAEPITPEEKTALIGFDSSFLDKGITITSCVNSISESNPTITLEYEVDKDISGTITLSDDSIGFSQSVPASFDSKAQSLSFDFIWWDEIDDQANITLSFEEQKSGTRAEFVEKANEWTIGQQEGFMFDKEEYILEDISITDYDGNPIKTESIEYEYNGADRKTGAKLNIIPTRSIKIGGQYFSGKTLLKAGIKEETVAGVTYQIEEDYIRYYDENATGRELKEIVINRSGYVEKMADLNLSYIISYNNEPKLPAVDKLTSAEYTQQTYPYVGDTFNKSDLSVKGFINKSKSESPLSLSVHYTIQDENGNDITSDIKNGEYKFQHSGKNKFTLYTKTETRSSIDLIVNVQSGTEKKASVTYDEQSFTSSNITIVNATSQITEDVSGESSIVDIEYTCSSTVVGWITIIMINDVVFKEIANVSFNETSEGQTIHNDFDITYEDWQQIESGATLVVSFRPNPEPVAAKTATLQPDTDAFNVAGIPLVDGAESLVVAEQEEGSAAEATWDLAEKTAIEMKFNVNLSSKDGTDINKEITLPAGSTQITISITSDDWNDIIDGSTLTVTPSYIPKTANVEIKDDFTAFLDCGKQPPQSIVTENETVELEFQAAATKKAKGVVYISPKNDPTNKLKTIDVDLDENYGKTFTFALDEEIWSHLGYGDTIEIHFEESVEPEPEPAKSITIEMPYNDSYSRYEQSSLQTFNVYNGETISFKITKDERLTEFNVLSTDFPTDNVGSWELWVGDYDMSDLFEIINDGTGHVALWKTNGDPFDFNEGDVIELKITANQDFTYNFVSAVTYSY